ncbi:response regulator [Salibacterium sp. K-3]
MNVIIAEDEMLERKAMRKFLEEHFPSIKVAAEAVNGRTAVELALEHEPEIVLMDIKMPGMDGMEAVARIQNRLPATRFIMVTAYDSFDYAKQAMKLGVKEYILKPGRKEETVEAIGRVIEGIEEERQHHRQEQHNLKLAKQLLLSCIIHDTPGKNEMLYDLYPRPVSAFFLVVETEHNETFSLSDIELKEWTTDDVIVNQEQGRQIIVLCVSSSQSSEEPKRLAKRIRRERGQHLLIGTGRVAETEESLSHSYVEALVDLQKKKGTHRFAGGDSQHLLEHIREAVEEADIQKAMPYLLHLLESEERDIRLEELYYSMKQILDARRIKGPEKQPDGMETEEDWYALIQDTCMKIRQYYHSLDKMERTRQWIDEHLNAPLTLEEAAGHAGLSASYFSQLFKEAAGENLTDYVTRRRLQKAVDLLKDQAYSLKEISYMVGYKDPNYFSRVFKKYYHLSPKQYQKTILKN